jgi:hypothetical protein
LCVRGVGPSGRSSCRPTLRAGPEIQTGPHVEPRASAERTHECGSARTPVCAHGGQPGEWWGTRSRSWGTHGGRPLREPQHVVFDAACVPLPLVFPTSDSWSEVLASWAASRHSASCFHACSSACVEPLPIRQARRTGPTAGSHRRNGRPPSECRAHRSTGGRDRADRKLFDNNAPMTHRQRHDRPHHPHRSDRTPRD